MNTIYVVILALGFAENYSKWARKVTKPTKRQYHDIDIYTHYRAHS